MTLAIGHKEKNRLVLDAIRERRPPFSPEKVVEEFSVLLKSYRVNKVTGDRYAGEWPRDRFRKLGITFSISDQTKSDLYVNMLATVNSGNVDLLDDSRLLAQLVGLERRSGRGGRDSIDHAPGAHDDLANAVAGVMGLLATASNYDSTFSWVSGSEVDERKAWQAARLWDHIRKYA